MIETNSDDDNKYDLDIVHGIIESVEHDTSELFKLTFFESNFAPFYTRLQIYKNKEYEVRYYTLEQLLSIAKNETDSLKIIKIKL
ncbi:MAG: hypothetical protein IPM42_13480 [Saprospiraceae bacterium]|nr:hypothetical protein [Saprospiraceae bacterium]